jgi:hypothetical protein
MTTGELLSLSSSVSNVSALVHLQNLDVGGGYTINSEIVVISQNDAIMLEEKDTSIPIEVTPMVTIEEDDTSVEIIEKEDIVYVVCEV